MDPLDRFEQGIENILQEFDLKLSKPQVHPVSQNGLINYYRDCDLRASNPARLVVERSWNGGDSDKCVLDFSIMQDCNDVVKNYSHINLSYTGILILDLNFFDFEKLRNYSPDLSLINLLKKTNKTLEAENFNTGKTQTFEILDDGSLKEISPLHLNSVRTMMIKDVLYETLYRYDKKDFKKIGDAFLQDLTAYFYKSRKELGFSF